MGSTTDLDVPEPSADDLVREAVEARENAYEPYSGFAVGAALLAESGEVYTGCNVENINFTNTVHAEQGAIADAVSNGEREFKALAVAPPEPTPPCGLCRQALSEFGDRDFPVLSVDVSKFDESGDVEKSVTVYDLGYLLPEMMESIE